MIGNMVTMFNGDSYWNLDKRLDIVSKLGKNILPTG